MNRRFFRHVPCGAVREASEYRDGWLESIDHPHFTPGDELTKNCGTCAATGRGSFVEVNRDNTVQFWGRRIWRPTFFNWFKTEVIEA